MRKMYDSQPLQFSLSVHLPVDQGDREVSGRAVSLGYRCGLGVEVDGRKTQLLADGEFVDWGISGVVGGAGIVCACATRETAVLRSPWDLRRTRR